HANGFEVTRSDHIRVNEHTRIRLHVLLTFRKHAALKWRRERQCGGDTCRGDPRQGADAIDDLTVILLAATFVVVIQCNVVWDCDEVLMLKSEIDSLCIRKAADEQTCGGQCHGRQSHLKENEQISPLKASCTSTAKTFLQVCC